MKQYVLDEPGARALDPELPAPARARRRWVWLILCAGTAAGALVTSQFVGIRTDKTVAAAQPAVVPDDVVPAVVAMPGSVDAAKPVAPSAEQIPMSRVTREHGRYVVDLHAAAIGPVLAMLSEATHTTVTGSDVVAASPSRLTASFVTASPLAAWKGVFGDVANFAMSCGSSGCAVRFVSLVRDRSSAPSSTSLSPLPAPSPALVAAPVSGASNGLEPMPDN